MIIYSIRLIEIPDQQMSRLRAAFREGGLWHELSQSLPGHIHTDLLQNPCSSSRFLSIEFWLSFDACLAAQSRQELKTFRDWLVSNTKRFEDLGVFAFPSQLPNRFPIAEEIDVAFRK